MSYYQPKGTSFNTQPPEGGWVITALLSTPSLAFQHTAARRRLAVWDGSFKKAWTFQHTAARRRLDPALTRTFYYYCFNTQPPEGGWCSGLIRGLMYKSVSTHSRPKAAGGTASRWRSDEVVSTHSRPKAAGALRQQHGLTQQFQHTAARRRLGCLRLVLGHCRFCFNTQPPEGGWAATAGRRVSFGSFNTQPPEGGWSLSQKPCSIRFRSPDFAKLLRKAQTRV